MSKRLFVKSRVATRSVVSVMGIAAAVLLLAACAPAYNSRPGYYGGQPSGYSGGQQCYQGCGYVREIHQVQLQSGNSNGAAIGTVIGAVVGGLIGNQVGGGKGKTAATVAGAVGGGFAGHAIGERSGNGDYGWQVVVQLNNGQYATVTQRSAPQVRVGDYVMVRNNQVYRY
ncbi:MAG TPA: glycine zipper 2TM domain-containing protein [Rhodanobacteraceae bacterium]|nr:glycine zipper 2TM domain-containing protein [Rhodanobacteraceae bacterium]